jgi:nickel transport protein
LNDAEQNRFPNGHSVSRFGKMTPLALERTMRVFRVFVLATVAMGGVLLAPAIASAHDMRADVTVADEVKVVAYFDDDTPAQSATVSVVDANGNEILTGKADERGVWTFAKPAPGQYMLTAKCLGHVAKVEFRVEGGPDTPPVVFTGWRLQKAIGVTVGLVVLLGISAVSWFLRRHRRG